MDINVLIADDDYGMRLVLKKAIEKVGGYKVLGEAENGEATLRLFEEFHPEVIFIDVEMPKMTGVECAKRIIDINPRTFIIFATAHNEFMNEAFELYAFDYIVKPFKIERIFQTLERVKTLIEEREAHSINTITKHEKVLEKILIKNKEGINFVDMRDIVIIQREDRNTVLYTVNDSYTTSDGLAEIEERLDRNQFFRSHKSYIINLAMIYKIYPYGRWTYIVKLKNTDKDALLTHDKYEELKKIFNL